MKHYCLLIILVLFSCKSKKFCLEESSELSLKEGFFREIPTGVYNGISTAEITIVFNDFNIDDIEIKGFYFRNKFIGEKLNSNNFLLKGSIKLDQNNEDIPFKLENSETVISYLKKGKQKFIKFSLKKISNSIDNVPMEKN